MLRVAMGAAQRGAGAGPQNPPIIRSFTPQCGHFDTPLQLVARGGVHVF